MVVCEVAVRNLPMLPRCKDYCAHSFLKDACVKIAPFIGIKGSNMLCMMPAAAAAQTRITFSSLLPGKLIPGFERQCKVFLRGSALSSHGAIAVSINSWQDLGPSHSRIQAHSLLRYLLFSTSCSCTQVDTHQPLLKFGAFSGIFLFPVLAELGSLLLFGGREARDSNELAG